MVDKKARKPPFKPAVVYVRSNPERFEAKLNKGYLEPVGRPKRVTQKYFMKHFAILDRAKITELSKMVFDCRCKVRMASEIGCHYAPYKVNA